MGKPSRVAQWLERWSYEPNVVGSNPTSRKYFFLNLNYKIGTLNF